MYLYAKIAYFCYNFSMDTKNLYDKYCVKNIKAFSQKLIPNLDYPVYGIQVPLLREMAEEIEDLDLFDIREIFDSKCREFNELMNNSSIQHKPLPGIGTFTLLPPTKKGRPSGRKGGLAIETFQMISTPSSQGGHNRCNATWHSPRQP